MKPAEFWDLTFGEFLLLIDGFNWREKRERANFAWLIQMLGQWKEDMQPTLAELMGETEDSEAPTREELLEEG